jgi:acyl-coenzyme A thioesterase PaaI-like protein
MKRPQNPAKNLALEQPLMTAEISDETLRAAGWTVVETSGFLNLIGPLWERVVNGDHEYAISAVDKHHNRRNRVQGGVLMTLADRASGMIARLVSGRPTLATVQMDVHFIDAGKIGELLIAKPCVVRVTHSLIFTRTEVVAEDRVVATASGVFKILKDNS